VTYRHVCMYVRSSGQDTRMYAPYVTFSLMSESRISESVSSFSVSQKLTSQYFLHWSVSTLSSVDYPVSLLYISAYRLWLTSDSDSVNE
jgi:hypothetical protein